MPTIAMEILACCSTMPGVAAPTGGTHTRRRWASSVGRFSSEVDQGAMLKALHGPR
jgi:hypothetical protein